MALFAFFSKPGLARKLVKGVLGRSILGRFGGSVAARGFRSFARVIEIDRGWRKISRELKSLNNKVTIVGFPQTGRTSGRYDMHKLINVAAKNEFGWGPPKRSFLRSAIDENRATIRRLQSQIVFRVTGRTGNADRELFDLGEKVTQMVKNKICLSFYATNNALNLSSITLGDPDI